MPYLFLWSCGPVQDFIASARKGRDLWFGSWLLSEVSGAAAAAILEHGRLVLPATGDADELLAPDFDVPNKVLAIIDGVEPDEVGAAADQAARRRLLELAEGALEVVAGRGRDLVDAQPALQQIKDLLETAWAAVPQTAAFPSDRFKVEALLAARKSARTFAAPAFAAAGVPKSSLDGQREAVTKKGAGLQLGLTHGERLCGPGLLKRFGHEVARRQAMPETPGGRVASVSAFALATWLRPALGEPPESDRARQLRKAVEGFKEALDAVVLDPAQPDRIRLDTVSGGQEGPILGTLNPHAFFDSRLQELVDEAQISEKEWKKRRENVAEAHRHAMRAFLVRIEEACGVRLPSEPTAYYAILLADGDQMGRFLQRLDEEGVREVSKALTRFARAVRADVFPEGDLDRPDTLLGGQCVYAGGDDVLALVPVDRAIKVAGLLKDCFREHMERLPEHVGKQAGHPLPTLSVGISVGHHLVPFRDVLDGARAAERLAKEEAGRNAWAIRVVKRSGAPLDAYGRWDDDSANRLEDLRAGFLAADSEVRIPHGLPYDLRDVATRLHRGVAERGAASSHLEESELVRVLKQKNREGLVPSLRTALRAEEAAGLVGLADRMLVARALAGFGGAA